MKYLFLIFRLRALRKIWKYHREKEEHFFILTGLCKLDMTVARQALLTSRFHALEAKKIESLIKLMTA